MVSLGGGVRVGWGVLSPCDLHILYVMPAALQGLGLWGKDSEINHRKISA